MIATAHQPAYMPWLGLLHKISQAAVFISWDDVPMESSGFENRQRILGGQWLTVPVHRSRDMPIKDVRVANEHGWQRKHMRSIEQAYKGAPHWGDYKPVFEHVFTQRWERLADLNEFILTYLCAQFGITGLRGEKLSALGTTTHKGEQVLEACKRVGAWKYIFGAMGKDYANTRMFREQGVEPLEQVYVPKAYPQKPHSAREGELAAPGDFQPRLWAFDALLWLGPEQAREVMLAGGEIRRMP